MQLVESNEIKDNNVSEIQSLKELVKKGLEDGINYLDINAVNKEHKEEKVFENEK